MAYEKLAHTYIKYPYISVNLNKSDIKKNVLYYFHSTRCHLVRLDNGGLEPEVENKSFDWSDVITWHSVCFSCCGVCKHCTFIWLNVAI